MCPADEEEEQHGRDANISDGMLRTECLVMECLRTGRSAGKILWGY